jgi:hypothetical protein
MDVASDHLESRFELHGFSQAQAKHHGPKKFRTVAFEIARVREEIMTGMLVQ